MSPAISSAAPSECERLYSGEFDRRAVDIFESCFGNWSPTVNFAIVVSSNIWRTAFNPRLRATPRRVNL